MKSKKEVLEFVGTIIGGDREVNYGKPEDNFLRIANLWSSYKAVNFTSQDVAAMMVLMKVARLMNNPTHFDSWADIAGYGICGATLPDSQSLKKELEKIDEDISKLGEEWLRELNRKPKTISNNP